VGEKLNRGPREKTGGKNARGGGVVQRRRGLARRKKRRRPITVFQKGIYWVD